MNSIVLSGIGGNVFVSAERVEHELCIEFICAQIHNVSRVSSCDISVACQVHLNSISCRCHLGELEGSSNLVSCESTLSSSRCFNSLVISHCSGEGDLFAVNSERSALCESHGSSHHSEAGGECVLKSVTKCYLKGVGDNRAHSRFLKRTGICSEELLVNDLLSYGEYIFLCVGRNTCRSYRNRSGEHHVYALKLEGSSLGRIVSGIGIEEHISIAAVANGSVTLKSGVRSVCTDREFSVSGDLYITLDRHTKVGSIQHVFACNVDVFSSTGVVGVVCFCCCGCGIISVITILTSNCQGQYKKERKQQSSQFDEFFHN